MDNGEEQFNSKIIGGSIKLGKTRLAFGLAVPQHPTNTIGILQNWMQDTGRCPLCFCPLDDKCRCMNEYCSFVPPSPSLSKDGE